MTLMPFEKGRVRTVVEEDEVVLDEVFEEVFEEALEEVLDEAFDEVFEDEPSEVTDSDEVSPEVAVSSEVSV